jgi:hypothetical protein
MAITKQTIKALFGGEVEQEGSKQLFVVTYPTYQLLVSYRTIVGYRSEGSWLLTTAKYSRTTSKQLNQFSYGEKTIGWIEQEHLIELVRAAQCN